MLAGFAYCYSSLPKPNLYGIILIVGILSCLLELAAPALRDSKSRKATSTLKSLGYTGPVTVASGNQVLLQGQDDSIGIPVREGRSAQNLARLMNRYF